MHDFEMARQSLNAQVDALAHQVSNFRTLQRAALRRTIRGAAGPDDGALAASLVRIREMEFVAKDLRLAMDLNSRLPLTIGDLQCLTQTEEAVEAAQREWELLADTTFTHRQMA